MKRRPAFAAFSAPEARPIADLNTTPLIDVMLVLLIMFIVTVPLATHSVKLDLPTDSPLPAPSEPEIHRLDMDAAGRLFWNGAPVAEAALAERLAAVERAGPHAVLHLGAHAETRYEDFDRLLATVKGARIDRLGLVGNHAHAAAVAQR